MTNDFNKQDIKVSSNAAFCSKFKITKSRIWVIQCVIFSSKSNRNSLDIWINFLIVSTSECLGRVPLHFTSAML